MAYLTDSPYFSEKVSLKNGRYEWRYESEKGIFLSYDVQYGSQYVYGDFNHDGLRDAAVIMSENSGGTAEWVTVAFLINDGEKFVHRTSGYLGDRTLVNSIHQKNGKVLVDMFVHQDRDCMAGPTNHVIGVFEYGGDGPWMEGKRIFSKSIFDPIILMLKTPSAWLNGPSWGYVLERCKIF